MKGLDKETLNNVDKVDYIQKACKKAENLTNSRAVPAVPLTAPAGGLRTDLVIVRDFAGNIHRGKVVVKLIG